MNRNQFKTILIALILSLACSSAFAQEDLVMKAMRDELDRSMKKLQLERMEKPYFLSYTIIDAETASAAASFGGLTTKAEPMRYRYLKVQVRVGDYKLDNMNFFSYMASTGVNRGFGTIVLPIDDNYEEIRRQLWITTDLAYKKALEDISKKRAALANKNRNEESADFSREKAANLTDLLPATPINPSEMEGLVRGLSAVFKQSPGTATSSVSIVVSNFFNRYVNSEGASSLIRQPVIQLAIASSAQATDGQPLSAGFGYRTRLMSDLPPRAEIEAKIRMRSKEVAALRTAPMPERYAGPVLFEDEAASEIVFHTLMRHILATPEVLLDDQRYRSMLPLDTDSMLEKVGRRVLPEFMSLVDDPTARVSGKTPLLGVYKVDDEGIPTRRMQIVENGVLRNLLTGRAPVQGLPNSSGSFHNGGVTPSNLMLTASKSLPLEQLRTELLRSAKTRGHDYGIIVRKVDYTTRGGDNAGMAPGSLAVLLAYKRFADGHEEPIRNAIVNGINVGSFKEILAVSDTPVVWSAAYSPRTTNLYEPPGSTFVSVSSPALLFDDAAVQKPTGNVNKLPVVEHPYFSKSQ